MYQQKCALLAEISRTGTVYYSLLQNNILSTSRGKVSTQNSISQINQKDMFEKS